MAGMWTYCMWQLFLSLVDFSVGYYHMPCRSYRSCRSVHMTNSLAQSSSAWVPPSESVQNLRVCYPQWEDAFSFLPLVLIHPCGNRSGRNSWSFERKALFCSFTKHWAGSHMDPWEPGDKSKQSHLQGTPFLRRTGGEAEKYERPRSSGRLSTLCSSRDSKDSSLCAHMHGTATLT